MFLMYESNNLLQKGKARQLLKDTFLVGILGESGVEGVADVVENCRCCHGRLDANHCGNGISLEHFLPEHEPGVRCTRQQPPNARSG